MSFGAEHKARVLFRPFALAVAALIILGAACAAPAHAAAEPARARQLYDAAAKDWRELLRNEERGKTRDPWLNLEKRFLTVKAEDPKGATGAKAQYQAARCREELAGRSFLSSDWKYAAEHYLALAREFPANSLADDGLYQAASIMARRLDNPKEARTVAQSVIDKYPKGDMATKARTLLASLPGAAPAKERGAAKPPAPVRREASAPRRAEAAAPATLATPATELGRVLCRGTSRQSTVLLELDGAASFSHRYMAPTSSGLPARLVVDIDNVRVGAGVSADENIAGMAASRVRAFPLKDGKRTRVIIYLRDVRHYTVESGADPQGIHVRCSMAADIAGGITPPAGGGNGAVMRGGQTAFAGPAVQPGTLAEQLGLTVRTIMIDAGHGGKDPGAMGVGIRESAVTLRLAKFLGERLRRQGFTVLYTRETDRSVPLEQRAVIANNKKADLFISLHVNANKDAKIHGLETYFLDLARTSSAATVAARENAVSVKSISDLQFILTDIMLTSKLRESQDLAALVHKEMCGRVRRAGFTVGDNGVRSAPFYVLMGARMPAVLVEIGYLTNKTDAQRIKSSKYLERVADGIVLGITAYKDKLGHFAGK